MDLYADRIIRNLSFACISCVQIETTPERDILKYILRGMVVVLPRSTRRRCHVNRLAGRAEAVVSIVPHGVV
jgi:hypothetical protein